MRKSKLMAERYLMSESIRVMQNVRHEREGHAAGGPEQGQEAEIKDEENAVGQPNEPRQDEGNELPDGIEVKEDNQDVVDNIEEAARIEEKQDYSEVNRRVFLCQW